MKAKKDLNKLSFEQLKAEVEKLEQQKQEATTKKVDVWNVGKNYFIRTVTHHLTGKLVEVTDKELVLEKACWIADSGRFTNALKDEVFDEVEVFPDRPVIVGRGALIDAVEILKLPDRQK